MYLLCILISYVILVCLILIISKFIYFLLKKKTKLQSFSCLLLTIITILISCYLFKHFIKSMIDTLMMLSALFIYIFLYEPLNYKYSSSMILTVLFNAVVTFLSIVGLFLILKFNDKISFEKNKILKFFTVFLTIVLSLVIIFVLSFLINII